MIKNTLVSHTNKAFQIYAKFEALKACEAESKTSMLFLDSVHAKTIIQSKKGGKKYFHQIGYALGQNLAKFEALKACEAELKTSMLFLDSVQILYLAKLFLMFFFPHPCITFL